MLTLKGFLTALALRSFFNTQLAMDHRLVDRYNRLEVINAIR